MIPTIPSSPTGYDPRNEAEFRRAIEKAVGLLPSVLGTGMWRRGPGEIIRETARGVTEVTVLGTNKTVPRRLSATDAPHYVPGNMYQSIMNCYNAMRDDFSDIPVASHSFYGVIEVPAGIHDLSAELLFQDCCNLTITGPDGGMGDEGLTTLGNYNHRGGGICQLNAPATANKFAIKVEATGSHNFSGPSIQNMVLVGNATCLGGLHIANYSNMKVRNVKTADFVNGPGFWINGDGAASQYGYFEFLRDFGSKYGLRLTESSGHYFAGIMFSGDRNNSDGLLANSVGIWQDGVAIQGSNIFSGARVQGYAKLLDIEDDDGSTFLGFRGEGWATNGPGIHLRNTLGGSGRCEYTTFFGGVMNNNLSGATGTAIKLESGVSKSVIIMPHIEAVTTQIDNSSGNENHFFLLDGIHPYVNQLRASDIGVDMDGGTAVGAQVDRFEIFDKAGNSIGFVPVHAAS
jgi:hypothetical protein